MTQLASLLKVINHLHPCNRVLLCKYLQVHTIKTHTLYKPFSAVAPTPIEVMAVQEGLTSIRVSWSAPYIPSNTSITGYIVQYTGGDSSENVSLFSTAESYLVTGLNTGDMYTISVVSTSKHISSAAVMQEVTLGKNNYDIIIVAPPTPVGAWSMALGLRQRFEYYYYY